MTKKKFSKIIASVIALAFVITAVAVPMTLSASANQTLKQTWDFSTLKDSDADENGESVKTITNGDGTILSKNPNSGTIGGFWIDNNAIIASGQDPKALVRLNLKLSDNLVKGKKYKFNLGVYTATGTGWPDASQIRLFYAPSALTYPEACQFNTTDWTDKIPDSAELLCKLSYAKNIPTETDNVIEMSFTAEKDYSDGYLVVWFNGSHDNYHRFAFNSADLYETVVEPTTTEPTTVEPTTAKPTTAEPTTAEPTTVEPTTAEPTTAEPTTAEPTTAEPTDPNALQTWRIGSFNKAYEGTGKSPETNIIDPNNVVENDNGTVVFSGSYKNGWHRLQDGMLTITVYGGDSKAKMRVNYKLANDLKAGKTYRFTVEAISDFGWLDYSRINLYYCDKPLVIESNDVDDVNLDNFDEELLASYDISKTIKKLPSSGTIDIDFTAAKDYAAGGYITLWFDGAYQAAGTYQVGGAKLLNSEQPTTAEPTTAEPTTAEPTTAEPTTAEPTTAEPTTAEPTTAGPVMDDTTTAQPDVDEPTSEDPVDDEPTADDTTDNDNGFEPSQDSDVNDENGTASSVETPSNMKGLGGGPNTGAAAAPIAAMALAACAACVAFYARKK